MKRLAMADACVIVYFCLMASLLHYPVGRVTADRSRQAVCRANLQKFGAANAMLLSDRDDRFPDPWQAIFDSCQGRRPPGECSSNGAHTAFPGEIARQCRWHNKEYDLEVHPGYGTALWLYIQDKTVLSCPTFRGLARQIGIYHDGHNPYISNFHVQHSYSMNARIGPGTRWDKSRSIPNPSEVFLWAEENLWPLDAARGFNPALSNWVLNDTALLVAPRGSTSGTDCFGSFHQAPGGDIDAGVSNVLFVDGHVSTASPRDSVRLGWPDGGL